MNYDEIVNFAVSNVSHVFVVNPGYCGNMYIKQTDKTRWLAIDKITEEIRFLIK